MTTARGLGTRLRDALRGGLRSLAGERVSAAHAELAARHEALLQAHARMVEQDRRHCRIAELTSDSRFCFRLRKGRAPRLE